MSAARGSVTAVLDDGFDAVARCWAPWVGVLWLTGLPYRLFQVLLVHRLMVLGAAAFEHGQHVRQVAVGLVATFVVAVVGRTVYARACMLALESRSSAGWSALVPRVPDACGHLLVASLLLVVEALLAVTVVAIPVVAGCFAFAAAGCQGLTKVGVVAPVRAAGHGMVAGRSLLPLAFVGSVGILIAFLNLYFAFQVGLWLADGVAGANLATWQQLLSYRSPVFLLLLGGGAALLVEPFWIGSACAAVNAARSRRTGDDLRQRLAWLARGEAA